MAYSAVVCRVTTRPHPNADKVQLGSATGYQVVIGHEVESGDLGVFFPTDGQLSERFCAEHDLIGRTDPETGLRSGGYFSSKRRVRSQKFRGERSDGFWVPLSYFDYLKLPAGTLVEGLTFSELNGELICEKYYTPATLRQMQAGTAKKKNAHFPEHYDTSQYKHNKGDIPADSIIFFTEKVHGTSQRSGYVLEEFPIKRSWFRRAVDALLRRPEPIILKYTELVGTRRVILNHKPEDDTGFYGSHAFRHEMHNKYFAGQMHKGEIFYYEVVGFAGPYQPIMSAQNTAALKDKEISKLYGPEMTYSYGCDPASKMCEVYVYRITNTTEGGQIIDLSWQQVKKRCRDLGVPHVPEVCGHVTYHSDQPWRLDNVVDATCEGESTLDSRHIREGVCLRIESGERDPYVLKAKSFTFGVLEGYLREVEEFVDLEEIS